MIQIIDTSSLKGISAIVTSACVSSTYEVESTKDIVKMWKIIKDGLKLKDDLDFVSAILATGRIQHGKEETRDPARIMEIVETFKSDITRRSEDLLFSQKEYCAAFLSASCVAHSKKIVSAKDIVNLWEDIRKNIDISTDEDIISAVITAGRIVDTRCQTEGFMAISDSFNNVASEVKKKSGDVEMGYRALASAYISSAAIEITPKVEKIRDMVSAWLAIYNQLKIGSDIDYIAAILTAGRIKDLNAQHFMIPESITDIHNKIVEYINEID